MLRARRVLRLLPWALVTLQLLMQAGSALAATNTQIVTVANSAVGPIESPISSSNPLPVVVGTGEDATFTDCSSTITLGGTAQVASAASTTRKYLFILNPASASETLWVNITGTATANGEATGNIGLAASQSFLWSSGFVPTNALSVVGATTAHKFTCTTA